MDEDVYFVETRNADHRMPVRTVVRTPAVSPTTATRVSYAPPPQAVIYPAQYRPQATSPWLGPSSAYSPGPI